MKKRLSGPAYFLPVILLCRLFLFPATLASQPHYPYGFRNLPVTMGRTVPAYTAVQDSSRFLWIGTESGLLKYDGYRSVHYGFRHGDSTSLCHDHVNALLYCPEYGRMAVGTDAGVSVYDFSSDRFYTLKACGYRQVKSLLLDGDVLWVGTADGLLRFSCGKGLPERAQQDGKGPETGAGAYLPPGPSPSNDRN